MVKWRNEVITYVLTCVVHFVMCGDVVFQQDWYAVQWPSRCKCAAEVANGRLPYPLVTFCSRSLSSDSAIRSASGLTSVTARTWEFTSSIRSKYVFRVS